MTNPNIAAPLALHARSRAGHPAIVHGERVVDYRELDRQVSQTAAHLLALGAAQGDAVGVALSDSVEHIVVMFALARAGIVMLPLDWRWTAEEQDRVAVHFGAKFVLVEPDGQRLASTPMVGVDDAWRAGVARAPRTGAFAHGDGPLLMSLSSGTTGRPKGPRLTHGQFLRRFWVHWINLGFNSQDRYLSATPLYYGAGRTFCMQAIYSGATVLLFPPPHKPEALCDAIAHHRASAVFLVPTMLRRLLALPDARLAPWHALRLLLSSGAALHPGERAEIRTRLCAGFIEAYSSTEGGSISYLTGQDPPRYDGSVGRAAFAVEVQCVDEAHQPLPAGHVGRIRYHGPGVADGFWNDPEASNEAFRDGWYYPGDLGLLDEDGYLYLKGRAKDVIIRGGVNIYPSEIEAVLQTHPAVRECAVVGWPSRERNEEVAAFVILDGAVTPAELAALCSAHLAPYKVPREVFVVAEFPRNALGKVLKSQLTATLPAL